MTKKLKIRFTKFEKALAMQILEQEGSFCDSEHIQTGIPELCRDDIYLCEEDERDNLNHVSMLEFLSNELRDVYLNNVIRWISEEQFCEEQFCEELTVGELCEVRNKNTDDVWRIRKLITILPEPYYSPYIVEAHEGRGCCWQAFDQARPIKNSNPKIDGDIYTWEE